MAEDDSKSHEQLRENDDDISDEKSSSESPPSKLARISPEESSGTVTTAAVSPPLNMGLNLTLATESSLEVTESSKTGFTFMQLQEYYHQELIFKHILAGVPVPIHLVLPIWKSVAASYGPHHYPSFAGLGHLCYDFRNSMEPEPGRCRRTDGKKWRCSRDVVPEQKYCERHMHRGRNRSRKAVELTVSDSTPNAAITVDEDANNGTSSNDVTIARIGVSPVSVLNNGSITACQTSVV